MYNGIGLQTPRGSGTNGYIQTNKFFVRPRSNNNNNSDNKGFEAGEGMAGVTKKPNKDILEHDRKRQIQLKLVILEDKLSEQGFTDAEIADRLDEARKTLEAAAASEETGGPLAVIVSENKFSDTQTHQIAARKERQMEKFRDALGLDFSEKKEQGGEGSDEEPRNRRKNSLNDAIPEHTFLDRDFGWKKHLETERGDKNKAAKDAKSKKESNENRRHGDDSSDTYSSGKHGKRILKKHRKSSRESDRDGNAGKKKKTFKKYKKRIRIDSEDSDGSTDDDADVGKKTENLKKHKKSRRHDSEDSDSATDDDTVGKVTSRRQVQKFGKSSRRHDSDEDSGSGEGLDNGRTQEGKEPMITRKRVDSDSDSDTRMAKKGSHYEKRRTQQSESRRIESDDSDAEQRKRKDDRFWEINKGHNVDSEYDLGKVRKHKKESTNRSRRRNSSDSDNSDSSSDEEMEMHQRSKRPDTNVNGKTTMGRPKSVERKPVSGSDISNSDDDSGSSASDETHERTGKINIEKRSGHGVDLNSRGARIGHGSRLEEGEFRSSVVEYDGRKRSITDKSTHGSQDTMRGKRKLDDENREQQPESKSRTRVIGKETEYNRDHQVDRSDLNKDGQRRDDTCGLDISRGYDDEKLAREGRIYRKNLESQRESRRNDRDYEDHRGGKRSYRDEEDRRGRKHERDEEDRKYRRHGRGVEEERGSKSYERDTTFDHSKRPRYDDYRSSERRYASDKHADDKVRLQD